MKIIRWSHLALDAFLAVVGCGGGGGGGNGEQHSDAGTTGSPKMEECTPTP
jgi:hypothetical protein